MPCNRRRFCSTIFAGVLGVSFAGALLPSDVLPAELGFAEVGGVSKVFARDSRRARRRRMRARRRQRRRALRRARRQRRGRGMMVGGEYSRPLGSPMPSFGLDPSDLRSVHRHRHARRRGRISRGRGSLVADTLVWSESGFVRIDELSVGDRVRTLDRDQMSTSLVPIKRVIRGRDKPVLEVTMLSNANAPARVLLTDNHRFYAMGRGLVRADELAIWDRVVLAEGRIGKILKIREAGVRPVYNLELQGGKGFLVSYVRCWVESL